MPREPLRQEQVPGGPVDVRHGRVAEGVERIQAVEPRPPLALVPQELKEADTDVCRNDAVDPGGVAADPHGGKVVRVRLCSIGICAKQGGVDWMSYFTKEIGHHPQDLPAITAFDQPAPT